MTEAQIKDSLIALLDGIKKADAGVITAEMTKLDEVAERGRLALHPQLLHFLERRSYAKALQFLAGDATSIPPGGCSGRKGAA